MAYSEILADRVRRALGRRRVEEKKMFGGIAFMVNGKLCVTVGRNRLMCRIDPELHDDATQRKGARTVKMGGRAYRGYVYVDEDSVHLKSQLEYWLKRSLNFNKKAKAPRTQKKK